MSFTSFLWHYAERNHNRVVQSLFMLYSMHLSVNFKLAALFKSVILLFIGYLALTCCARLPGRALGKKERISSNAIVNSASTSACTASSCASAGFSGIARGPLTVQVRSRHRLSSLPAFALQKNARAKFGKPNFASKYSLESSRRDLNNALLCTVLVGSVWVF